MRIVCVGNRWRSDDAAGLEVAGRLRGTLPAGVELSEREGEPTALIDAWEGADALWLVDAVSSGAEAGTVHRLDASERELPAGLFRGSTHHVGLAEAVELARALGRLPRRTVVYGVEGGSFEVGDELTPAVAAAVGRVAEAVREEVVECMRER
ncbi:MAG: hydrogenase maturation protease [Gaiellaceae bacterium]